MDHLFVPRDRAVPVDAGRRLLARLQAEGVLDGELPGARGARWTSRFAAIRVEDPGAVVLFSNELGGFRATCPITGAALAGPFGRALTRWRANGPFALSCPACGRDHALDAVRFAPPAAFGRFAIRTIDVDGEPTDEALAWVEAELGATDAVLSRVGWR